jgi:hypothetical protein
MFRSAALEPTRIDAPPRPHYIAQVTDFMLELTEDLMGDLVPGKGVRLDTLNLDAYIYVYNAEGTEFPAIGVRRFRPGRFF